MSNRISKRSLFSQHLGCWVRRIQSLRLIWPTKWDPVLTNKKGSSKRKRRRGQEGEREEGRRRKKERKSEANMDVFKLETLHQVLISSADSELFSFLNSLLVKKKLKNLKKFLISFWVSRNLSSYIVESADKITLQLPLSFQLLSSQWCHHSSVSFTRLLRKHKCLL